MKNITNYFWLTIAAVVFYLLNCLYPLMSDDYVYSFFFYDNDVYTSRTINSFSDLIASCRNIYFLQNGRVLSHFFLQLFAGMWGKAIFNLINTFVFILSILLMRKVIFPDLPIKKGTGELFLVLLFYLAFVVMPAETHLWLSGAVNYLWPMAAGLLVVYFFDTYIRENKLLPVNSYLCFPVGFILAQGHELLSSSLAGGLFIWFVLHPAQFRGRNASFAIGFALSTLLVFFAPGILLRASSGISIQDSPFAFFANRAGVFFALGGKSVMPVVLLLISVIYLINNGIKEFLRFIQHEIFLVSIILLNAAFLFLAQVSFLRAYYFISVFSFILLIRLVRKPLTSLLKRKKSGLLAFMSIFLLFVVLKAFDTCRDLNVYFNYVTEYIQKSEARVIIPVPDFDVKRFYSPSALCISPNESHFVNKTLCQYYKKEKIQCVPKDISIGLSDYLSCNRQLSADNTNNEDNRTGVTPESGPDLQKHISERRSFIRKGNILLLPIRESEIAKDSEWIIYLKKDKEYERARLPFYKYYLRELRNDLMCEKAEYYTLDIAGTTYVVIADKENLSGVNIPIRIEKNKEEYVSFDLRNI